MTWRERSFEVSWRLAVLVLPWQTRWFSDASLGGWPWEQGRWSVYASWIPLVLTILLGISLPLTKGETKRGSVRWIALPIFILLTLVTTLSRVATTQWWIEVLLLAAFVVTLIRNGVQRRSLMTWFAISLVPHALLAIWQYFTGFVVASKWFGIAGHAAVDLGASVVQHGDVRLLRAYGGFPHPNILGAWMVVGLLVTFELAARAMSKRSALWWSFVSALFSATLVVTYSRGAWIGAVVGIIVMVGAGLVPALYGRPNRATTRVAPTQQFFFIALVAAVAIGGAVAFSQRDHILARADLSQRLEAKSMDVRMQSLRDGWDLFQSHLLFGTGPNAELVPLMTACGPNCPAPLEPPHDVPLIILVDLGIIGTLLLGAFVWFLRPRFGLEALPLLVAVIPVALVDHLLWSTWSGLCLVALLCILTKGENGGKLRTPED